MRNLLIIFFCFLTISCAKKKSENSIDLSGTWGFSIDSLDQGIAERWFEMQLPDSIELPGSMAENLKGDDITVNTRWTGTVMDSSWYNSDEYKKYRQPDNIKVAFWLQPTKHFVGAAWYQKEFDLPTDWEDKKFELYLERCHISTQVWVNGISFSKQNSLSTPHIYDVTNALKAGKNRISLLLDNRLTDFNVGSNSHSITDHTQTNWNGIVGKIKIQEVANIQIGDVKITSDIMSKKINAQIQIMNHVSTASSAIVRVSANATHNSQSFKKIEKEIKVDSVAMVSIDYTLGDKAELWDEFNPALYNFKIELIADDMVDTKEIQFGLREFKAQGTQFAVNNRITFLRGTLDCAIFPLTGYVPTDTTSWMRIFRTAKSFGLNHMRFHSYCPPKAAFIAADIMGFYLQVECPSWANFDVTVGDGLPVDRYIYDESERIVKEYGNHPSFCLFLTGNEPSGKSMNQWLNDWVLYWKQKDSRFLTSTASGWPITPDIDFCVTPYPRVQNWGEGMKSIINSKNPSSDYNWADRIKDFSFPTLSHEIGQWCAYPDFKEIRKYTGVLKAKNFEIFQETLNANGLGHLADSFLLSSGKLQALCYKADIEAALRTPGFGGFQLLDLHDFPGQGTALVGVLNAFWEEKGYITANEYSKFCNSVVPLLKSNKLIFSSKDTLNATIEIANFGKNILRNVSITWEIKEGNKTILKESFNKESIAIGNCIELGVIKTKLDLITKPSALKIIITVGDYQNDWNIWVYPESEISNRDDVYITDKVDAEAQKILNEGGNVFLYIPKGKLSDVFGGNIVPGFSSIFWNTAWTSKQPPHTLGILCNPNHPAFDLFPTNYHSDYQWQFAMSNASAINLTVLNPKLNPLVRIIDDWFTNRSLALIFEANVGKGKIVVCGIDFSKGSNRPEADQLKHSLMEYIRSNSFAPKETLSIDGLKSLYKQ